MTVPDITVGLGQDDVLWTDEDADQTWVPAPHPDLGMDPAADRVWVLDLPAAGDVTLTVERDGATVHQQTVHTTNVFIRGDWLLDMWTQPTGNEPRPAVALFDLGAFDLRAGDVVTVTDGSRPAHRHASPRLTVDSIDPVTDTVTGTADPDVDVACTSAKAQEGFWGYSTVADAGGHWTFHFDARPVPVPGPRTRHARGGDHRPQHDRLLDGRGGRSR